jgi:hypothetical protein
LNPGFLDMLDALGVSLSDLELTGNVIRLRLPPRHIDLLTSVTAVSFEEVWRDKPFLRRSQMPAPEFRARQGQ